MSTFGFPTGGDQVNDTTYVASQVTVIPNQARQKWKIVRGVIVSGWVLTLLVMLGIIGTCLYLWVMSRPVPDPLLALAGVAVASLLKDFAATIKDFINE